ncbi:MAG: hypothetical protein B6I35_12540 [Anaerolineaceae bacterium 4572_32.2]|nr:MAG: hypothetical protein B6I35_12540 [Anaerolineaceae bacterium 4572_32.2]
MKTIIAIVLVLIILITPALAGCRSATDRPSAAPTENVQATVDAAVEATRKAEESQAATIEASVAATQSAAAAAQTPTEAAQEQLTPTPTPSSEEYTSMSEEELAALIDKAVNEAVAATEEAAAETESATTDGSLSQEEVQAIEETLALAEEAIALAEELIYVYSDLYVALAQEALVVLQETEQLLAETTKLIAAITEILIDVDQILDQGAQVTPETIDELAALAEAAEANAAKIQTQYATWFDDLLAEFDERAAAALAIPPTEIATNRREAINSAYDYIEAVTSSLADNKISAQELSALTQAGANASASLKAQGGPQLQNLVASLNDITAKIVQGQLPDIQGLLATLQAALPAPPSLP